MVIEIRTLAASVHGGEDCPGRTMRELSGMMKSFYVLREVLGTWAYTFVKSNHTTELRSVPFNVCNLCQYIIKKKYRKHIKRKNACLLHKERRKERKKNRQKEDIFSMQLKQSCTTLGLILLVFNICQDQICQDSSVFWNRATVPEIPHVVCRLPLLS